MRTRSELNTKNLAKKYQLRIVKGRFVHQIIGMLTMCCLYLSTEKAQAQVLDSMQLKVGTVVTVASQDYQLLWLVSNRWGTIADQQADVSSYLTFYNKHVFGNTNPIYSYLRSSRKYPEFSLSYGLSVYNNQLFQETYLQEGYVKLNLNHWQLKAGRYKEIVGEVDPLLSSGSLGVSGNALPIPKISIGVEDYTDLPFIEPGYIQFKGQLSHGWMEKDAFVKNAMFHQRSMYLRLGKRFFKTFNLFGGLNQFIIWGGDHPDKGKLPGEWKDFTNIIMPGNNLGFFDYGFNLVTPDYKLSAYTQVPFEGKGSINPFRVKDRLVGFVLSDKRSDALLSSVTLELINTTWQDPDPENTTSANDYNFYNNERYPMGWSYAGSIIGTPLFFDRQRAVNYFGEGFNSNMGYDWNIVNNRINGIHVGVKGNLPSEGFYYRTLLTFTINNGNYYNGILFVNRKKQCYLMQEFIYQYGALKLNATIGYDMGGLTNNAGALVGVEYDLTYKPDNKQLGPVKFRRKKSSFRRRH